MIGNSQRGPVRRAMFPERNSSLPLQLVGELSQSRLCVNNAALLCV
ncbi:unnamed protein product, partial [Staurois parvus]